MQVSDVIGVGFSETEEGDPGRNVRGVGCAEGVVELTTSGLQNSSFATIELVRVPNTIL